MLIESISLKADESMLLRAALEHLEGESQQRRPSLGIAHRSTP
jgi:hypothetical protein